MKNIAVIGSGPCGAIAALKLLSLGHQVTMLDIGDEYSPNSAYVGNRRGKINVKGHESAYDVNEFNKIDDLGKVKNWYSSKVIGGFSHVWGATWEKQIRIIGSDWDRAYKEVDELVFNSPSTNESKVSFGSELIVSEVCTCFLQNERSLSLKFGKENESRIKWQYPNLAISSTRCDFNGGCINHCPNNAIWTALELIEICRGNQNFHYIGNSFVEKLQLKKESVGLLINDTLEYFDGCVLSAGPVGNSLLLLRSRISNQIRLNDTRIGSLAFLRFSKPMFHFGKFSLSGFSITFRVGKNEEFDTHLQLYAHTDNFIERLANKFSVFRSTNLKLLFDKVSPYVVFGLLYLDQNCSDKIDLTSGNPPKMSYVGVKKQKSTMIRSYFYLLKNSFSLGLIPIPYIDFGKPGDSYHLGAGDQDGVLIDDYGFLHQDNRIMISGSFSLPYVLPGSITRSSMAQTIRMLNSKKFKHGY